MKKTDKKDRALKICRFVAEFFIILILLESIDFVKAVITDKNSYEIRYEADADTTGGQKLYRLYINDEYYDDVDYNLYSSVDENGNTDYKYCYIIYWARRLCYEIIVMGMVIVVFNIVTNSKETPFTPQNTARIRLIGALQLALSIVPGLVVFLMKFFRFSYINASMSFDGLYMFIIGGVIMIVAQVFDYGVKLQQDNDLIA